MHVISFSKIATLSWIAVCQLALFHCNSDLNSKLNLTLSKFSTQNCTFHHLVGKKETIFWSSFLPLINTGNTIEKFNHDPAHFVGRYNQSQSQLVNGNWSRSSNGRIQKRLWGNCEVKVIHLDWTLRRYLIADNLLEEIILRNENPDYILFVAGFRNYVNSTTTWTPENFNFIFGAFLYTLTSKFLFLDGNLDLYLLCSHCHTSSLWRSKNLKIETETSLVEIHIMWYTVHKNLDKQTMDILSTSLTRFTFPLYCSAYKSKTRLTVPRVEDCVIVELQKRFNFSLEETTKSNTSFKTVTVGGMFYGSISGASFNRDVFLAQSVYKQRWINYASAYYPYIAVTFLGSSNANFLSLVEPLDRYCWAGLVCTYIFVILLIFAHSKLNQSWEVRIIGGNSNAIILKKAWMWTLSVLLEQSSHHLLRRVQWTCWIAASCWILLSFIVSNGYKGDLFSSMAAQRHPTVPNSIHDLVTDFDNLPMMTTTRHYTFGKYAHSTLKDIVLPDMLEDLPSSNNLHQRLRDKLVFLNGSDAALIINISMGLKVTTDLGYPLSVSEDFALVSSESDAKVFTILARRFTKYLSIQNSNQVSPYITRVPWFGFRNFFINIFTHSLSSLLETGIYGKWSRYHKGLNRAQALKNVDDKIHQGQEVNSTKDTSKSTNYYAMAMLASKRAKNNNSILKGVSLQNVKIAIIFCSICASVGCLTFVFEIIFHLRTRVFVQQRLPQLTKKVHRKQTNSLILN